MGPQCGFQHAHTESVRLLGLPEPAASQGRFSSTQPTEE